MSRSSDRLTVAPEPLASADAQALISRLNAELTERYPDPEDRHFGLAEAQVSGDSGVFLLARLGAAPAGCGALRRLDGDTGELKRMYVTPAARRCGVGRRVLEELERHARQLGLRRLVLETGVHQHEAMGLYERAGFARIPCFGEYERSPASVCMERRWTDRSSPRQPGRRGAAGARSNRWRPSLVRRSYWNSRRMPALVKIELTSKRPAATITFISAPCRGAKRCHDRKSSPGGTPCAAPRNLLTEDGGQTLMERVVVSIDGSNFFHACRASFGRTDVNVGAFANFLVGA